MMVQLSLGNCDHYQTGKSLLHRNRERYNLNSLRVINNEFMYIELVNEKKKNTLESHKMKIYAPISHIRRTRDQK